MNIFLLVIFILMILSFLLIFLGTLFSQKLILDREKMSPFECGFMPKMLPRLPLSLRFFLIAIIFLVFDVELVIIFPFVTLIMHNYFFKSIFIYFLFIFFLIFGLYYEVNQGSLNWAK